MTVDTIEMVEAIPKTIPATPTPELNPAVSTIWSKGPDELIPSDSFYSNSLSTPVKLRSKEIDEKRYPAMSMYTMFKKTVDANPNHPALAYKSDDKWCFFSYAEYWRMCMKAAKSMIKLGLQVNECVTIVGFNAPQWFVSNLGGIFAGGVACGIYTTNTVEACEHILTDCKSPIVVVENKLQLDKILKCIERGKCNIRAIIQYTGEVEDNQNGLIRSWLEFMEYGLDIPDSQLDDRIKQMAPNKCSTLIYTSGTTGAPKAAMISQDSMTYLVRNIGNDQCKLKFNDERFVSYLPLSHIAAQSVDIYCSIFTGGTTYFAQPDALKGTLTNTLVEAKPTFFFGVPRVLEKIQEKLQGVLKFSGLKLKLFEWAREVSYDYHVNRFYGNQSKSNVKYAIAKKLIFNKLHRKMGLDKVRLILSAAAPITKETLDYFLSIGFPLVECYGMSETTGPHAVGTPWANRVTSVGVIDQYNRSKIVNKDEEDSGELCIYGRHVFMGYLNNPEKTKEAFSEDAWLHTGDIAKIDADGYLYITGRLKELIITAGGENIPPVPIEDKIKAELPRIISNCMLVGDKKKFLVVLVTLKCKVNPDDLKPQDELTPDCIEWLESIGSKSTKISEIVDYKDQLVYKQIENGIKTANAYSTSRAAKVQKFAILPTDFSLPNGELGPTLKLRRPIVTKMYSSYIEELYADSGAAE